MGKADLVGYVVGGVVVATAIYLLVRGAIQRRRIDLQETAESALAGTLFPLGLDLVWCALEPARLAHITDQEGKRIHDPNFVVVVGDLHRIDMAVGGIVLAVLSVLMLVYICRK